MLIELSFDTVMSVSIVRRTANNCFMEHRLLGGAGFSVPVLTMGTGTFGGTNEF
jgi:hypothetical protein